jgi:hypothetical protein
MRSLCIAAASAAGTYFYDPRSGAERRRHLKARVDRWRTGVMRRIGLDPSPFSGPVDSVAVPSMGIADDSITGVRLSRTSVGLD